MQGRTRGYAALTVNAVARVYVLLLPYCWRPYVTCVCGGQTFGLVMDLWQRFDTKGKVSRFCGVRCACAASCSRAYPTATAL
eukprot:3091820-Rhodomonas_salina.2